MIIVAEPLSGWVALNTTELTSDCRIEEGDEFPRAEIKASSKLPAIVSIVEAQVERKVKGSETPRSKLCSRFPRSGME
jgi:hypothetical protein